MKGSKMNRHSKQAMEIHRRTGLGIALAVIVTLSGCGGGGSSSGSSGGGGGGSGRGGRRPERVQAHVQHRQAVTAANPVSPGRRVVLQNDGGSGHRPRLHHHDGQRTLLP